MRVVTIECAGVRSEREFWDRYLAATQADGSEFFGRNMNAFRDALLGGGPGWPGEVSLTLVESEVLAKFLGGSFLSELKAIAASQSDVSISFL